MTPTHLGLMAALGLACLASSVLIRRKASGLVEDVLDRVYH